MRFADTTAIFEYHAGANAPRVETRRLLADRRHVATSEHVVREWKRIIVHAMNDLLVALREEPDLPAVLGRLSQGFGREPSQRLRALGLCAGPDSLDRTEMEIRARQILRVEIDRYVDEIVGEIRRPSECPLAANDPYQEVGGEWRIDWTCRRNAGICDRVERIGGDIARWDAGAAALVASDRGDYRRQGQAARRMSAEPDYRTGKLCYQSTGDLGIALDARSGEELVTTDRSFTVICAPLGLTVRLVATAAPPDATG